VVITCVSVLLIVDVTLEVADVIRKRHVSVERGGVRCDEVGERSLLGEICVWKS
jgi:hypothetical protein